KKAVGRLRGEVPGIEEQKKLLDRQKQMLAVKAGLETVQKRWVELSRKVRTLDKEHGGRKAVDMKIADASEKFEAEQDRLRQTSGRAAVVHEAIQFLEKLGDPDAPCPVCGTEMPDLLDTLRQLWTNKLQALVDRIKVKIGELKDRIKELRGIIGQYEKLNE